ncbi:hypothetical protein VXQ18_07160 [Brucella abortus]|nr:hypothetical protein [Brucella abortus]
MGTYIRSSAETDAQVGDPRQRCDPHHRLGSGRARDRGRRKSRRDAARAASNMRWQAVAATRTPSTIRRASIVPTSRSISRSRWLPPCVRAS